MRAGLSSRMLLGLVLGAVAGTLAHLAWVERPALEAIIGYVTEPVGAVFLRLLFMLVLPLVVSALALGVAELRDLGRLGRIGWRTLVYTVVVSSIAVALGVAMVNLIRPGEGLDAVARERLTCLLYTSPSPRDS